MAIRKTDQQRIIAFVKTASAADLLWIKSLVQDALEAQPIDRAARDVAVRAKRTRKKEDKATVDAA
jgi:hypothetical protein